MASGIHEKAVSGNHLYSNAEIDSIVLSILREPTAFYSGSEEYVKCKAVLRQAIEKLYISDPAGRFSLGILGDISFPSVSFGNIDTSHLFGIDELILFIFYWMNRNSYVSALDLGANIGLHTILLSKFGYNVKSFEPDPDHIDILCKNINLNNCKNIEVFNKAVFLRNELRDFIRVKNNSTGSHISGLKNDVYGPIDTFSVECVRFREIVPSHAVLIKMDIEGAEGDVICSTRKSDWFETDILVEVGSPENANNIFRHLENMGVNMFPQKNGWNKATNTADLPINYLEGSLFLSLKERMPW